MHYCGCRGERKEKPYLLQDLAMITATETKVSCRTLTLYVILPYPTPLGKRNDRSSDEPGFYQNLEAQLYFTEATASEPIGTHLSTCMCSSTFRIWSLARKVYRSVPTGMYRGAAMDPVVPYCTCTACLHDKRPRFTDRAYSSHYFPDQRLIPDPDCGGLTTAFQNFQKDGLTIKLSNSFRPRPVCLRPAW